jgi:hypothetical protein
VPDQAMVAEVEETLMLRWDTNEAVPLLHDLLANYSYHGSSRLMYLLGLAYELTGDEANAVKTYWNLWHDYPETAYARLAESKLELKR